MLLLTFAHLSDCLCCWLNKQNAWRTAALLVTVNKITHKHTQTHKHTYRFHLSSAIVKLVHSFNYLDIKFWCGFRVDAKRVKLLRYNDPLLGPRKLPNFENFTAEKSAVDAGDTFGVDIDKNAVTLRCRETDCTVAVGSQLIYVITSWHLTHLVIIVLSCSTMTHSPPCCSQRAYN